MNPIGEDGFSKKKQNQYLKEVLKQCLHVLDTGKGSLPGNETLEALVHFCIEEGDQSAALKIADILVERIPYSSDAWHIKSLAQVHAHDKANALISINKAKALNPNDPGINITHAMLQEHILTKDETISMYHSLMDVFPGNDEVLYALGQYYEKQSMYQEAIKIFTFLVNSEEFHRHALSDLGYCNDCLEQYEVALTWYDQYLEIEPFDHVIWFNKAVVLCHLEQFNAAISCYDFALAIKEDFAGAWYNRGNALGSLGRLLEAIESYRTSLEYESTDVAGWHNLGSTLEETGAFRDAIEAFSMAVVHDPLHYESYYGRGSCHDALEEYASAIADYDKALSLQPGYADVWQAKADALFNIHRPEESIICYKQALQLSPDNIECAIDCIRTYIELHEYKDAKELIDTYIEEYSTNAELLYESAKVDTYLGNHEEALEHLKISHSLEHKSIDDLKRDFPDLLTDLELFKLFT
ncbi:MAG: tetratricopeptide repeat protein [Candidatus Kapaibacteriota bacterium]